ncbi:STAS domain-containing protein [Streptomyces sp. NPDC093228]|uniref:STAS domain-containing protein n=1 Tax=unclassified Streptomyces TaxID=2593676 RepID=UPI0029A0A06F|nr:MULTISPECIES: STAS domain-containing protein [unclassified Streptomyces]MDX3264039.1 STAS domain-containing protein [Streptomyces sp. MI02-2A]
MRTQGADGSRLAGPSDQVLAHGAESERGHVPALGAVPGPIRGCVVGATGHPDGTHATAGARHPAGCLLDLHLHDVITRHGPARIVLDLSGLTFCDASGLRVLVRAHHAARRCHGRLHLVCPHGLTRYLLRITGLSETIPAHRTLSHALAPVGADRPHGRGPAWAGIAHDGTGTS